MVSTSININCKFLSSLGEIVFFYSDLFASKNHSQNVGANSLRKTSLLLVETIFLVSKKHFFHFSDIPGCENTFSAKLRNVFLNSWFWLVDTDFQSIGIFFRTLLKQTLLVETDFIASRNYFFPFLRYSS